MAIRLAVFDMAGTTVWDEDDAVAGRLCDALHAAGMQVRPVDVDPVMGIPKPQAIRELMGPDAEDAKADAIHADFRRRIVEHYRSAPDVREIDGAGELFRELRSRGVRVALDTGFDRETLDTIVERLGWAGLIDDAIASSEVSRGRPDPEMILVLMERAGIEDPAEVAKVGDSVSDLEQGERAGCGALFAVRNQRTVPALGDHPSAIVIDALDEIIPALESGGLLAVEAETTR